MRPRRGHNGPVDEASWSGGDVTVVIAAYNAAATIDQALASVAAQDERPHEVLVADDASTDDTAQLAERWAERIPVRVLRLAHNGGPAVARAEAIDGATTGLVALLDADDCWLPDHLATMLEAFRRQPGLVTADALPWIAGRTLARRSLGDEHPIPAVEDQLVELIRRNFVFMGTLFERERYVAVGGFRPQFKGTEDWDLWIRMARAGTPISRPDHPTVLYRLTPSSLSARDDQVDAEQAVVDAGLVDATSDRERRALQSKARRLAAQRQLFSAYDAAREGRPVRARWHAARAVGGQRRVALRALVVLLAPRWAVGQRDGRRHEPRWWFKRL